MGDKDAFVEDFVQLARLAVEEKSEDVRLFLARLVRRHRKDDPEFSDKLDRILKSRRNEGHRSFRDSGPNNWQQNEESSSNGKHLLKEYSAPGPINPILTPELKNVFFQFLDERRNIDRLNRLNLSPSTSAIFVGPPGVGKTLSARWLATELGLPLYVLDLTSVMSSFLGKTGENIRSALDFAKENPSVLLLDEIDAIAKSRSDVSDVGELKRLVTVILQEIDDWPETSLLLAATNHSELIDKAIWRRFDLVVEFEGPDKDQLQNAIRTFAGSDYRYFEKSVDLLSLVFADYSFSDLEREIMNARRRFALKHFSGEEWIEHLLAQTRHSFDKNQQIEIAKLMVKKTSLSQRSISKLTGVSRDTIRNRANAKGKGV